MLSAKAYCTYTHVVLGCGHFHLPAMCLMLGHLHVGLLDPEIWPESLIIDAGKWKSSKHMLQTVGIPI